MRSIVRASVSCSMPVNSISLAWASLNPAHPGLSATEKAIRVATLWFVGLSVYQLTDIRLLKGLFDYGPVFRSPADILVYALDVGLVPIATVAFWRRKALAWMVLTSYLAFSLAVSLWAFWSAIGRKSSGIIAFDGLHTLSSPALLLMWAAAVAYTLYQMSRPAFRAAFAINAGLLRVTVALVLLLGIIMVAL